MLLAHQTTGDLTENDSFGTFQYTVTMFKQQLLNQGGRCGGAYSLCGTSTGQAASGLNSTLRVLLALYVYNAVCMSLSRRGRALVQHHAGIGASRAPHSGAGGETCCSKGATTFLSGAGHDKQTQHIHTSN